MKEEGPLLARACKHHHRHAKGTPLATQLRTPGQQLWVVCASVIGGFIKRLLMKVTHTEGQASQDAEQCGEEMRLLKMCNERQNKSPISANAVVKSLNDRGIFSGAPHSLL